MRSPEAVQPAMDFIDLKAQQKRIKDRIDANIQKVLAHGQYIMGPEIRELEEALAAFAGARHALACASGTDALLLALMALEVGPGDAVFTTPFTFIATAEAISLLGATPVFVDIDPRTFNLDPAKLELACEALRRGDDTIHPLPQGFRRAGCPGPCGAGCGAAGGPATGGKSLYGPGSPFSAKPAPVVSTPARPRAVIPVDLFGLCADYDALHAAARRHGLAVVEDAAQSFGALYRGRRAGSLAELACTSFFPAKPLGAYGDGGMCFCDDGGLAEVLRSLRVHGQGGHKYENVRIGINGRLDTLQAAILLAKFAIFPEELDLREQAARRYDALLAGGPVSTPVIPEGCRSAWAQYSVLAKDEPHRAALQKALREAGVPTAIYYPRPLHLQEAFAPLGYRAGDFPASEDCAARIFSLPMHPYLSRDAQEAVAAALRGK